MERSLDDRDYDERIREMIADCVKLQEDIGLDVPVHG
jgi:methionine synthase II (cobalamin-independent)